MKRFTQVVGDKSFEVIDYPGGEKGTIFAIHGLTGNFNSLSFYADALSKEYRVISYDLRGRGNSSPADADTSIYTHTEDALQLIEAINIEKPILLGYSMGAFISAMVASKMKDIEALILLDGAGKTAPEKRELIKPSIGRLGKAYESQEAYVDEVKTIFSSLGVEWGPRLELTAKYEIKEENGVWKHKSSPEAIEQDFESFYTFESKSFFPSIQCKTLLFTAKEGLGANPPLFDDETYVDTIKYANNLETIDTSCNHYTLVQQNQPIINNQIKEFLLKNE
ncbi:hypothetical protein BTR23_03035 [Alkalihalophilus pseudofirmus]|nr:hypothetical protein BTR23_03035 [Alkalihalophilus pseudofirmus]